MRWVQLAFSDHDGDPETHVIELRGEVDLNSAPAFADRMDEAITSGKTRVVVDLSEVPFCDTTGPWVLVNGCKRLKAGGGSLEIICTNETILKTFEITGVSQLIPVRKRPDDVAPTLRGDEAAAERPQLALSGDASTRPGTAGS